MQRGVSVAKPAGFDPAAMQAAILKFQQSTQAASRISIGSVPNMASYATPYNQFALPADTVTEADTEAVATDAETCCAIRFSGALTTTNGKLQNAKTKAFAAPFKASGPKPTLKMEHQNPTVQQGLATKQIHLFGGKFTANVTSQQYGDYRVYANVQAREGELGYNETSGLAAPGCVYAKVSAAQLATNNGRIENLVIWDHSLSENDAAMLRMLGTNLLPDNFDKQHISIGTHVLVPETSAVYRKYMKLSTVDAAYPALSRVNDLPLVAMEKAVFNELAPPVKKITIDWYTPIDPAALELTIVPEPRMDEKGDPVNGSFWGTMRRAPKDQAAEMAEKINLSVDGIYTCHTCTCDEP